MPAFGKDGILKAEEIRQVANYVRTLSKLPPEPGVDLAAGKKIFADNCAVCHGDEGKGNIELGAANLTDGTATLRLGHKGPHPDDRLCAQQRDAGLGWPP